MNQSIKSTNKKKFYNTLGTSILFSPMPFPSYILIFQECPHHFMGKEGGGGFRIHLQIYGILTNLQIPISEEKYQFPIPKINFFSNQKGWKVIFVSLFCYCFCSVCDNGSWLQKKSLVKTTRKVLMNDW